MSAQLKRGIIVWVLGFLTFLAAINVLNAVMYGVDKSAEDTIKPYFIKSIMPNGIMIRDYFWISVVATCVLLALTSIMAFRRSPDPHILWRLDKLEEDMADSRETIRATHTSLLEDIENSKENRAKLMNKINTSLADTREEMLSKLENNEKRMQETTDNLQKATSEMMRTLVECGESIQQMNKSIETMTKETGKTLKSTMKKQTAQIEETRERVEKLEEMLLPKPKLTSRNKPEDIKGVGPTLGEELRNLGINTVADLITADPRTLAGETRASRDTIQHLQTIAQLLMIPGINENHAELLEEAGVTTRKQLATQEPLQLSQKLENITKTYVEEGKLEESEKPTIEEIVSWIRQAKI